MLLVSLYCHTTKTKKPNIRDKKKIKRRANTREILRDQCHHLHHSLQSSKLLLNTEWERTTEKKNPLKTFTKPFTTIQSSQVLMTPNSRQSGSSANSTRKFLVGLRVLRTTSWMSLLGNTNTTYAYNTTTCHSYCQRRNPRLDLPNKEALHVVLIIMGNIKGKFLCFTTWQVVGNFCHFSFQLQHKNVL